MKKIISLFLLCFALLEVHGQVNLVPNPSFEDTLECGGFFDNTVKDWKAFKESPDYFSPYCTPSLILEFNGKVAHSGNAYAGFISYANNPLDGREFLGVELISPLIVGEKYFVSFFLSAGLSNGSYNIASNNSGMMFSTYSYYDIVTAPNPNFSKIKTNEIISETENWLKISGSFIADSAYTHLIIGNLYDNIYTDTLHLPSSSAPNRGYSLVDDVCLTTDSLYNEVWTGLTTNIAEIDNINLIYYPNPVNDFFNIKSDISFSSIELFNYLGQSVFFKENLNENSLSIHLEEYIKGCYILKLNLSNNRQELIKIVIN